MPVYMFKNSESGEVEEHSMRISELDKFKDDNPHLTVHLGATRTVSGVGTVKTDDGFKEVLHKIAESHPSSPLAEGLGGRSRAAVKTADVVEKLSRDHRGYISKDGQGGF